MSSEQSFYSDERWLQDGATGYWPQEQIGKIILARYVSDQKGADVYIADGMSLDDEMTAEEGNELIRTAQIRHHLEPWRDIDLPYLMPDDLPGNLNFLAVPVIKIFKDERMIRELE